MSNYAKALEEKNLREEAAQEWQALLKTNTAIPLEALQKWSIINQNKTLLDHFLEQTLNRNEWIECQPPRVLSRILQTCLRSDINHTEGAKKIMSSLPDDFYTSPHFISLVEKMGWRHGHLAWSLGWKPSYEVVLKMAEKWNRQWMSEYAKYKTKEEWLAALNEWNQTLHCIGPTRIADWCRLITAGRIHATSGGTFVDEHDKVIGGKEVNTWFNQAAPSVAKKESAYTQHWIAWLQHHERSDILWLSLITSNWLTPDRIPKTRIPFEEKPTASQTSGFQRAIECVALLPSYKKQSWQLREQTYRAEHFSAIGFLSTVETLEYSKLYGMLQLTQGSLQHPLELHALIHQIDGSPQEAIKTDLSFIESPFEISF
jgi:hypothetical protein